jgi:hypothetical protein
MPEFLTQALADGPAVDPWHVLARLLAALVLGAVVAWVYGRTTHGEESAASLPTTLVLLAVLIAMVTQVIGDNVARAFSLVGALSIVRFRTVVRDTRDTAFVIFAVVVGMAVGSQHPWVAVIGIGVGGGASFLLAWKERRGAGVAGYTLRLRVAVGLELDGVLEQALPGGRWRMRWMGTGKQGMSLEAEFDVFPPAETSPEQLVKQLHRMEGVHDVRLTAHGMETE